MSSVLVIAFVTLLLAGGVGALAFFLGYTAGKGASDSQPNFATASALAERDAFIEHLRELAWQHRDVSPELATILIDDITNRRTQLTRNDQKDQ